MKAKPLKARQIVKILWMDSHSAGGWRRETPGLEPIVSVGIVMSSNPRELTLSTSVAPDQNSFIDPITIPWACIQSCEGVGAR